MQRPYISVVSAVFNEEKNILRTLQSLNNQDFKNFEYIIIDNNSTDKTIKIINEFVSNFKITLISESDDGIYFAWNKALKIFNGEYISFLGAGDEYINSSSLQDLVNESYKDHYDYIHAKYICNNRIYGEILLWDKFKKYMTIMHCGALMSKNFINTQGFFNEKYQYAADYEYLLRSKGLIKHLFINKALINMIGYGVSNTNPKVIIEAYQIKKDLAINSGFENIRQLLFLMIKFYLKKIKYSRFLGNFNK